MPAIPRAAQRRPVDAPLSGAAPFAVRFDGAASRAVVGDIASWTLDFGDGVTRHGSGAPPSSIAHTYRTAGENRARLTVVDGSGATSTANQTILVTSATRPTAWIWGEPATAFGSANVAFDASQSAPGAWTIDFGDRAPAVRGSGAPPSRIRHTYSTPGLYTATITVIDRKGEPSIARANTLISAVRTPAIVPIEIKSITSVSATVRSRLYADGAPTTAWYEYGTTKTFGSETDPRHVTTNAGIFLSSKLTGLSPHTKYFYRVVASNSRGIVHGTTRTFTTHST
jgi:PKD repeat protein